MRRRQYDNLLDILNAGNYNSHTCLEWSYNKNEDGYGHVYIPLNIKDRPCAMCAVHRVAFNWANGHWPEPECLHSCDNRACFNPFHLSEGTHLDNMRDQVRKGRSIKGSAKHDALLTEDKVVNIRKEYVDAHLSINELARKYGVTFMTIKNALIGKTWKHVEFPCPKLRAARREYMKSCRNGHPFVAGSFYSLIRKRDGLIVRLCKVCQRAYQAEYRNRKLLENSRA